LEEQFSWAFNLKDFDLIIENAFWRYKFAEPTCLQVKHVGCVILEYIEKANLKNINDGLTYMSLIKVNLKFFLAVSENLDTLAEKLNFLAVFNLETHCSN
jgi:hypothetical protein